MPSLAVLLILLLPAVPLLYGICTCIYNVFFHPLRSYPGPLIGRATRLWNIYHELHGDLHLQMKELHQKYGEVVRFAPNELSYNTGRAWQDICGHRTSSRSGSFEKDLTFNSPPVNGVKSILAATDEDHRRMRRLQSHAFSEKALTGQEGIIKHHIDLLISELHKRISGPENGIVNMMHWYNFTTFDIIGDLALGQPFGCLRDGVTHPFVEFLFGILKFAVYSRSCRRFPSPIKECLFWAIPKSLISGRIEHAKWSSDRARQRMAEGTYLHAVLEEGLRMYPPTPNTFPRTTPFPGENICGKYVPGGTSVGIHQFATMRSPKNFVEPDSFIPERFLDDPRFENDDKSAFNPFSYGPRNCLGKK